MVLAAGLLLIASAIHSLRLVSAAGDLASQYGLDFQYWYAASADMRAGVSPYPQRFFDDPVAAWDFGYKYPPTFAQAIVPLTMLGLPEATHLWASVQAGLGFLSVWLAAVLGGARRSLEHLLWSGVAFALFLPYVSSVFYGNVSAIQAFQVSLLLAGGVVAGSGLASAALLKTTALAFVPPAVVGDRRIAFAFLAGVVVLGGMSLLAAPQAWLDFLRIQPNLFLGSTAVNYNLHPASVLAWELPDLPIAADIVRAVSLGAGIVAVAVAVVLARARSGWPLAVALAVLGALIIPGAIWYHYLAMLLPLAAYSWPRATAGQRTSLFAGAGAVTLGSAWLPLATVGAGLMIAATLRVLAPRPGKWPVRP